jgi:hypothetical protein
LNFFELDEEDVSVACEFTRPVLPGQDGMDEITSGEMAMGVLFFL